MISIFKPLELTWRGVNRMRRHLYASGRMRQRELPRPVVSVGNISAGGSGKTPAVIAIAGMLIEQGLRPAVLTRGYGRETREDGMIVRGRDTSCFGDEPVLIAHRLPGVDVVVGADRYQSAMRYLRHHHCDLFLLDDGFQHLTLRRDLDIVIDDPDADVLREGRGALRDADIVLARDGRPGATWPPTFGAKLVPRSWQSVSNMKTLSEMRGTRAVAFSGLANNERFFNLARAVGVNVLETIPFRDHHRYSPSDLELLRGRGSSLRADVLVTTEKDLVKIEDDSDILALVVEMEITPRSEFETLLTAEVRAAAEQLEASKR